MNIFIKYLDGTDDALSGYLKSLKGGKASMSGYKAYCKQAGIETKAFGASSKAAAIGVTALNTAINMLISLGIGLVIQGIITGITHLINASDEAIEKANELTNAFNEFRQTNSDNIDKLQSLKEEFETLSHGVSRYGENISLTADEYDRYKQIVQTIVDISPALSEGYSIENGYLADKNELIERAIELQEQQYKSELRQITTTEKLSEVIKGYAASYDKLKNSDILTTDTDYFSTLSAAQAAAATAVEVGSSDGVYFYGENVCVVTDSAADLYIIQPDKTLKAVGTVVLGDDKSIEIVDGKVTLKGFNSATAGQQPRINAAGTALEWYTPDTSTVSGLADTVAGHTQDIQNLQTGKADKATTLEGYGITDAMTATAIAEAIQTAIAATGHASFKKVGTVPTAAEAQDNVLYLVMNADTGFYDIYAKVENEVVRLDDVSVNLDGYSTTEQMNEAIATAIANKVDKVDGKGLSTEDFTTALKEKLVALPDDAEANFVKSVSDEFTVSAEGKLEVKEVAQAKVTGLPDALAGKVDKVEGKGLSTNDFTDEAKAKLDGVEAGANQNLIEIVKLNGAALDISEKAVNIPVAGVTAGVVTSSADENKVAVAEDGSMEVNSLNMSKLVQSEGDTLILDGGNASV